MSDDLVLVTGGSGFIAAHCIALLHEHGYRVRATLRDLRREAAVRAALKRAGCDPGDRLSFVTADLLSDDGWSDAVAGCAYVLHVASPFPFKVPKDENELIVPARDGALRVLRAATRAGVRRVVLTSSFAAIGYGHPPNAGRVYTEEDWSDADSPTIAPYLKSKTIAERAAWDFVRGPENAGGVELATVNPVAVLGPVLAPDHSTSILLVKRILDGTVPGLPRLYFAVVDVRDVADLHLRAMTAPQAAGERFVAVSGEPISMTQIAHVLRQRLGEAGRRAPTRVLPDWIIKLMGRFDPQVRQIVPELGMLTRASGAKAETLLGWQPRSREDAIVATAKSLMELGVVKGG